MTSNTGPTARDPELTCICFLGPTVAVACPIHHPEYHAAPDPAPVGEAALRTTDALRTAVAMASVSFDGDPFYAIDAGLVQDTEHGDAVIEAARAALAVRPAPSATIPDEDLPGYRQPFTGPLGSRGDPTVALPAPSGDADAAWEQMTAGPCSICAQRPYEDPTGTVRCEHIQAIARAVRENRPLIEAAIRADIYAEDVAEYERPLLRAVAPSDGACPRCGRSGAALSCPDCYAEFRAPSDGAGGLALDRATLAQAIHDYMHLDSEGECDAPMDAGEIAKRYIKLSEPTS